MEAALTINLLCPTPMKYQTDSEFKELLQRYWALEPRSRVLEIGSLGGETLWHWIAGAGPGGTVVSVDLRVPPTDDRHESQKHGQEILWPQDRKSVV